jgi:hypothetical protein
LCVFFFLISNTSIARINFGANLDAQNAGNDISGIKNFLGEYTPRPLPTFMRGILATNVAFSHCYPPLIYYLTERSIFKKCPTTGKSLKKALGIISVMFSLATLVLINECKAQSDTRTAFTTQRFDTPVQCLQSSQ